MRSVIALRKFFCSIVCLTVIVSGLAASCYGQSPSQWFLGDWSGEIYQPNVNQHYTAELTINTLEPSAVIGTSRYPTLNCEGILTLVSSTSSQITLFETITTVGLGCVDGYIILELAGNNDIIFDGFYTNWFQSIFDQPLSRSRPIICGDPVIRDTFHSNHPDYHFYAMTTAICNSAQIPQGSCTVKKVFNKMISALKYQAPATATNLCKTVINCTQYPVLGLILSNPITVTVDESQSTAINYAMPNHLFYPGTVTRQVIQRDGQVIIITEGEGEGDFALFDWVFGPLLFDSIDNVLKQEFASGKLQC